MKISYKFATETNDIEVEDSWGTVILEFDRLEYNNNQKEKRRHCSLNAYDKDDIKTVVCLVDGELTDSNMAETKNMG